MLTGESLPVRKGRATASSVRRLTRVAASTIGRPGLAVTPLWHKSSNWCRRRKTQSASPTISRPCLSMAGARGPCHRHHNVRCVVLVVRPDRSVCPDSHDYCLRHCLPGCARVGNPDGGDGWDRPRRHERDSVQECFRFGRSHQLNVIVFDKTGTLTMGNPRSWTSSLPDVDANAMLGLAASVEQASEHPLAQAILKRAGALARPVATGFTNVDGMGPQPTSTGSPRYSVIGSSWLPTA